MLYPHNLVQPASNTYLCLSVTGNPTILPSLYSNWPGVRMWEGSRIWPSLSRSLFCSFIQLPPSVSSVIAAEITIDVLVEKLSIIIPISEIQIAVSMGRPLTPPFECGCVWTTNYRNVLPKLNCFKAFNQTLIIVMQTESTLQPESHKLGSRGRCRCSSRCRCW